MGRGGYEETVMNVVSKIAVLTLSVAGLSACASSQESTAYVPARTVESSPEPILTDDAYVAHVERVARRRGIYLQWVNLPTKRASQQ